MLKQVTTGFGLVVMCSALAFGAQAPSGEASQAGTTSAQAAPSGSQQQPQGQTKKSGKKKHKKHHKKQAAANTPSTDSASKP